MNRILLNIACGVIIVVCVIIIVRVNPNMEQFMSITKNHDRVDVDILKDTQKHYKEITEEGVVNMHVLKNNHCKKHVTSDYVDLTNIKDFEGKLYTPVLKLETNFVVGEENECLDVMGFRRTDIACEDQIIKCRGENDQQMFVNGSSDMINGTSACVFDQCSYFTNNDL
jgi:hypothetical protein